MTYEEVRLHLEPVRELFEAKRSLLIQDSYSSTTPGQPSFILSTKAEFLGAYLRDDKLVVMFRFEDKGIDPMHIDFVYETVRKRVKSIVHHTFPGLPKDALAVHVMDTSGNIGDFEF